MEDPDSRVDIVATARDDLKGIWRLRRAPGGRHPARVAEPPPVAADRVVRDEHAVTVERPSSKPPAVGRAAGRTRARGRRLAAAGRPDDPAWVRPALLGLLVATGVLYLWDLGASGWANSFYSAAVQAGTKSWKAFFFGSFDSSNFITVDKSPAALWVMELSARIFGVNSWSILVPNALEGVATVGVLYATVRRWFSPGAALLAGAVVALTPVAALMFRFNNPDAFLVLLLTAGRLRHRAGRRGRPDPLDRAGRRLGRLRLPGQDAAGLPGRARASRWSILLAAPGPAAAADPAAGCTAARPWWRRPAGGCWPSSSRPPRTGPTSAARRTTASGT